MGLLSFLNRKQSSQWGTMIIVEKEHQTSDFVVITLQKKGEDGFNTHFEPGQYITIEISQQGKTIRRSYSICGKSENGFKIGVKRIEGGQMSAYLHDAILGSALKVHAAEGHFVLNGEKQVCAFVAGSGITPVASMIEAFHDLKVFHVFYGIRYATDLPFQTLLNQTQSTVYLSKENKSGYKTGRLDYNALMDELKSDLTLLQADVYLLCGPEEFMKEIERGLSFFGVPESKIKREYFSPPSAKKNSEATESHIGKVKLTAIIDGHSSQFEFTAGKKSLLEGLEDAKLDPPYSCRGGVCSSCKAKIIQGKASMRQNFTLTDKEIQEGYILTCQADPVTEEITLSFDE